MASSVQARVKEIVCEQLGVSEEEVTPEASFIEDLGADSLDIVELVMALEEEYEMEISDEDAEKIRTVGDVVKYIEEHKKGAQALGGERPSKGALGLDSPPATSPTLAGPLCADKR